MNLGDAWINLQPIPVPTPEEIIEYSKDPMGNEILDVLPEIQELQPRLHLYGKSEGENGQIIIEILGLPEEQRINKLKITEGEGLSGKAQE